MNSEPLIHHLLQFGSLNSQQVDLINESVTVRTYKPGDYFLKAGQVSREIGFITNGIFRVCYYDNDGNEITRYFIDESNFLADINSFNTGVQTTEYVQAVTDCELIILSKQAMENLSRTIIVWDSIISKITAKALSEKVARISLMMPQDAATRYQSFLENFPNLANRIPLQYIASYIGVTKSSLSRLRRDMGKRNKANR
jgi:CRP-like cAMP-binding protein